MANIWTRTIDKLRHLPLLYYNASYIISTRRLQLVHKAGIIKSQKYMAISNANLPFRHLQFHALDHNPTFHLYKRFEKYNTNYRKRRSLIKITSIRLPKLSNVLKKTILSYPTNTMRRFSIQIRTASNNEKNIGVFLFNDAGWENNYYHWHIDFLLFVLRLRDTTPTDEITVLINRKIQPHQKQSLITLGIKPKQIQILNNCSNNIDLPHYTRLERNRLKCTVPQDMICHHEIKFLAKTVGKSLINKASFAKSHRSRILISRNDASTRRLINEHEIFERHLRKLNFEIVFLSSLDFNSQVSLFSNSECVIAPHGAGLTNIIYTRHCSVLEIFSKQHGVRPDYLQLSNAVGCEYFCYTDPIERAHSDVFLPYNTLIEYLQKTISK